MSCVCVDFFTLLSSFSIHARLYTANDSAKRVKKVCVFHLYAVEKKNEKLYRRSDQLKKKT